jgi:two-component system, response regulator PdtaR
MTEARPRLLVVDDDRAILSILVAGLARAGFDVIVATNVDEARRMAADANPALAIVDAQMEGGRGFDLADYLLREARMPFLVLVPTRDESVRKRAASCGASAVLAKPVDLSRLVPAIKAALERGAPPPPRPPSGEGLLADALEGGHGPQTLIAIGILVERHRVNCDEAVRLLHRQAEQAGLALDEFALVVIEKSEGAVRPPV